MANDKRPTTNDDGMANDKRPTTNDDRSGNKNFFVTLARYSQLAFVLPACTVVGWLIGVALDHWLHTTWIYLVGLLLGIAAGFVELVRTVMSAESKQ
ncbi:MAG: AtpZ/AtpI family protein [Terriglobales bacterium]|jgi:F0F1-type ATP synthase assembly protein I